VSARYHFDGHFPHPICGTFLGDGRRFILSEAFTFLQPGQEPIVVPQGFITDFNSVPRGLWNWFPPWEYLEAGIVHDYLYWLGKNTRQEADEVHRLIVGLKGANILKRRVIYLGLRVGGQGSWDDYRRMQEDDGA